MRKRAKEFNKHSLIRRKLAIIEHELESELITKVMVCLITALTITPQ